MKKEISYNRVCYLIIEKDFEKTVLREYFIKYGKTIKLSLITNKEILNKLNITNQIVYSIS